MVAASPASQADLMQAAGADSIRWLSAGIAHEINNSIAFVKSNLSTLGHYIDDLLALAAACTEVADALPGPVLDAMDSADLAHLRVDAPALVKESLQGIGRIVTMAVRLREFAQDAHPDWQIADLKQGLDAVLETLRKRIPPSIEIRQEYGDLPRVLCQSGALNLVFMSLMLNAAEAIRGSGLIRVRAGGTERQVWVEVIDNGTGIEAQLLARIFDPFFSTKRLGEGIGLGLFMAEGIVRHLGGRIEVESLPGTGSTFRVVLPVLVTESLPVQSPVSKGATSAPSVLAAGGSVAAPIP